MNTYLVADGGGTKTDFLWFAEDGAVLARAKGGGSNANFLSPQYAADNVAQGIKACLAARPDAGMPHTILLFIPGFAPAMDALRSRLAAPDVQLMDDFWNAFYGALGAPRGIVALAGTGSFVAGRSDCGPLVTVGGWGPLFGDWGSGYHLGVLCLRAVARRHDEGLPGGLLEELLLRHMEVETVGALRRAAYAPSFTRDKVAQLSYLAEQAAAGGDERAAALFEELAKALVDEVALLAGRIMAPDGLPVSVTGGMLGAKSWFLDAFRRAVEKRLPHLDYSPAKYSPLVGGALYLLAEQRGIDLSDGRVAQRLASK